MPATQRGGASSASRHRLEDWPFCHLGPPGRGRRFRLHVWRGMALGADACLQLHHPDPAEADRLIRLCLDEVARLEQVFSLYRPDSLPWPA